MYKPQLLLREIAFEKPTETNKKYIILKYLGRAMSIICPGLPYHDCLARFGPSTLHDRRQELCTSKLFSSISCLQNSLHSLLPPKHGIKHEKEAHI